MREDRGLRQAVTALARLTAVGAVLVQCTGAPPPPAATPVPVLPVPASPVPPPPALAAPTVRPVTADELGASWHPGCPVDPGQLQRIEVNYLGFDRQTHRGELIVHQDLVAQVITIFEQLYQLRYPIEKMRTVDHYPDAADELSMEDNNTSAFNCRDLPGTGRWSQHAYGRAIDVNPLLNPYISGSGDLQPTTARAYLDRTRTDPGLLHAGDPAVTTFTDRGWAWGGYWRNPIDYQHFERP